MELTFNNSPIDTDLYAVDLIVNTLILNSFNNIYSQSLLNFSCLSGVSSLGMCEFWKLKHVFIG